MDNAGELLLENVRKLTVIQLRRELEKRGLEKSGLKTCLVVRLETYLQECADLEAALDASRMEEVGEPVEGGSNFIPSDKIATLDEKTSCEQAESCGEVSASEEKPTQNAAPTLVNSSTLENEGLENDSGETPIQANSADVEDSCDVEIVPVDGSQSKRGNVIDEEAPAEEECSTSFKTAVCNLGKNPSVDELVVLEGMESAESPIKALELVEQNIVSTKNVPPRNDDTPVPEVATSEATANKSKEEAYDELESEGNNVRRDILMDGSLPKYESVDTGTVLSQDDVDASVTHSVSVNESATINEPLGEASSADEPKHTSRSESPVEDTECNLTDIIIEEILPVQSLDKPESQEELVGSQTLVTPVVEGSLSFESVEMQEKAKETSLTIEKVKKMTVIQLKRELDERGLDKSGLKAALVTRLGNYLKENAAEKNSVGTVSKNIPENNDLDHVTEIPASQELGADVSLEGLAEKVSESINLEKNSELPTIGVNSTNEEPDSSVAADRLDSIDTCDTAKKVFETAISEVSSEAFATQDNAKSGVELTRETLQENSVDDVVMIDDDDDDDDSISLKADSDSEEFAGKGKSGSTKTEQEGSKEGCDVVLIDDNDDTENMEIDMDVDEDEVTTNQTTMVTNEEGGTAVDTSSTVKDVGQGAVVVIDDEENSSDEKSTETEKSQETTELSATVKSPDMDSPAEEKVSVVEAQWARKKCDVVTIDDDGDEEDKTTEEKATAETNITESLTEKGRTVTGTSDVVIIDDEDSDDAMEGEGKKKAKKKDKKKKQKDKKKVEKKKHASKDVKEFSESKSKDTKGSAKELTNEKNDSPKDTPKSKTSSKDLLDKVNDIAKEILDELKEKEEISKEAQEWANGMPIELREKEETDLQNDKAVQDRISVKDTNPEKAGKDSMKDESKDLVKKSLQGLPALWISGLSSKTTAVDLKNHFSPYGKVIGAKVLTSAKTPGMQCFGFVTMLTLLETFRCIEKAHKSVIHEKIIQVEQARKDPIQRNRPPKEPIETLAIKEKGLRVGGENIVKTIAKRVPSQKPSASVYGKTAVVERAPPVVVKKPLVVVKQPVVIGKKPAPVDKAGSVFQKKAPIVEKKIDIKPPTSMSNPLKALSKVGGKRAESKWDKVEPPSPTTKTTDQLRTEKMELELTIQVEQEEHEKALREERRREQEKREKHEKLIREREQERRDKELREERRREQKKRDEQRRERARAEAERIRRERKKEKEAERERELEREQERERFIRERKAREENERQAKEAKKRLEEAEEIAQLRRERDRLEEERMRIVKEARARVEKEEQERQLAEAMREKERQEMEARIREEMEAEAKARAEKEEQELRERLEKERREREERELRQKVEREIREREEKERKERAERLRKETEKLDRLERERQEEEERQWQERLAKDCLEEERLHKEKERLENQQKEREKRSALIDRGLSLGSLGALGSGKRHSLSSRDENEPQKKKRSTLEPSKANAIPGKPIPSRWDAPPGIKDKNSSSRYNRNRSPSPTASLTNSHDSPTNSGTVLNTSDVLDIPGHLTSGSTGDRIQDSRYRHSDHSISRDVSHGQGSGYYKSRDYELHDRELSNRNKNFELRSENSRFQERRPIDENELNDYDYGDFESRSPDLKKSKSRDGDLRKAHSRERDSRDRELIDRRLSDHDLRDSRDNLSDRDYRDPNPADPTDPIVIEDLESRARSLTGSDSRDRNSSDGSARDFKVNRDSRDSRYRRSRERDVIDDEEHESYTRGRSPGVQHESRDDSSVSQKEERTASASYQKNSPGQTNSKNILTSYNNSILSGSTINYNSGVTGVRLQNTLPYASGNYGALGLPSVLPLSNMGTNVYGQPLQVVPTANPALALQAGYAAAAQGLRLQTPVAGVRLGRDGRLEYTTQPNPVVKTNLSFVNRKF